MQRMGEIEWYNDYKEQYSLFLEFVKYYKKKFDLFLVIRFKNLLLLIYVCKVLVIENKIIVFFCVL